ncbi:hypothetical protein CALVIDRAFT_306152 [Calocera viscosa TUFC12733]|uniref:F-box domain-containing protein n=1 Tax=Calocera viscosa (strain TUFC12733) TaxID=1330018 RepID=A0A167IA13_CALVF|nr:hypothetical protein CALVIDRAFT_306152 [Calocera viscosa TUFC12733]
MLLTLPVELVDAIIDSVDNPHDLAALSAVCKQLKEKISPAAGTELGILQCCYLSVEANDASSFSVLADRPKLAQSVRRLRIPDFNSADDRPYWRARNEGNPVQILVPSIMGDAISRMVNLRYFSCDINVSAFLLWNDVFKDWSMYCPALKEIYLRIHQSMGHPRTKPAPLVLFNGLHGLQALRVRVNAFDYDETAFQQLVGAMSTTLSCNAASLLPSLLSLTLLHEDYYPFEACYALRDFLRQHPTIKSLKLFAISPALDVGMDEDTLPSLRELSVNTEYEHHFTPLFRPLSNDEYRPLARIDLAWMHSNDVADDVVPHLPSIHTLKGLCFNIKWSPNHREMLAELAKIRPELEELHGRFNGSYCVGDYLKLLRLFPNLRTVQNYNQPSMNGDIGAVLCESGRMNPALMCVDDWVRREDNSWKKSKRMAEKWKWALVQENAYEEDTLTPIGSVSLSSST